MHIQTLLTATALWAAVPALSQSLLDALRANGFTAQADLLEDSPVLTAGPGLIVYAASNAAIARNRGLPVSRREVTDEDLAEAGGPYSCVEGLNDLNEWPEKLKRQEGGDASGSARQTLLSDARFVNLGPGRNQTLVEKRLDSEERSVVFTGLGASSRVIADDIPFDGGLSVIRPIGEVLTLPRNLSESLPFINAERFLSALQRTGLLPDLDARPVVTVLAPSDAVLGNITNTAALERILRQHILVGSKYPGYTPLLQDGDTFTTLAGTTVTVTVRGGDVRFDGVPVVAGDAITINGVVHTVGGLLPVPSTTTAAPTSIVTGGAEGARAVVWKSVVAVVLGVVAAGFYL